MADTLQYVNWHLEQACPFRQGAAVTEFGPAWNATWQLRAIDDAEARKDVFGDICVTSHSYYGGVTSPYSGFRISHAVSAAGDLEEARTACQRCPANGHSPAGSRMAGCCGHLPIDPDDRELEATLRSAIASDDLRVPFANAFPLTKPIWYGLWLSRPFSLDQLQVLSRILPSIRRQPQAIAQFHRACVIAVEHGHVLNASMPPPGHTDLGAYWTWPHCPQCKKRVASRSTTTIACATCGFQYVPAETTSIEEDEFGGDELEQLMSPEEYQALCVEWRKRHPSELIENWRPEKVARSKRSFLARLWDGLTR